MGRLHHKLEFPDRFLPHLESSCPGEEPKTSVRHFVVHLENNTDKFRIIPGLDQKTSDLHRQKIPSARWRFHRWGTDFSPCGPG